MKNLSIMFVALFIVACSPKYKIIKEYQQNSLSTNSLNLCKEKEKSCQNRCQKNFSQCKIKADKEAQKSYNRKLKEYVQKLEIYADLVDRYNFEMEFAYFDSYYDYPYCRVSPFYRSPFWHEPMYYLPNRPKKPSLEEEKLKFEAKMCQLDCGCQNIYDECFIAYGGVIKKKKICIENCPNE